MTGARTILTIAISCCISLPTAGVGRPMKQGFAEINGTRLYYEMQGKGPAVVLIHSGGFDRRIWDDQFSTFADRYTVIRYDVRGYGKSPPPTKPYSDEEDLYKLLEVLGVAKAHVIGVSMGGRIAVDFALTHPDMVRSLVPVASSVSGYPYAPEDTLELVKVIYSIQNDDGTPAGEAWLRSAYNAAAMENPAVAATLRPIAIENSRAWLMNIFFPRMPFPLAIQRLSDIRVPVLVVRGDRDVPTIVKIAEILEKGIPGARKVVIAGAGHQVNVEKAKEFNAAVLDFLSKQ